MVTRRRVLIAGAVAALAILALVIAWPSLVHHLLIARVHGLTHRPVSVDAVHLNLFTGRLDVQGLRVLEHEDRQDQVLRREAVFAHQGARGGVAAQATRAHGGKALGVMAHSGLTSGGAMSRRGPGDNTAQAQLAKVCGE